MMTSSFTIVFKAKRSTGNTVDDCSGPLPRAAGVGFIVPAKIIRETPEKFAAFCANFGRGFAEVL
jgi:hypothetical protein